MGGQGLHSRDAPDGRDDRGGHGRGRTVSDLLKDFPYLEEADIAEALAYAACLAQGREVRLGD